MVKFVQVCILMCCVLFLKAQNPVDFTCAGLDVNNNSELTWNLPNVLCGAANFQYTILISENFEGPYTNIAILGDETIVNFTDASGVGDNTSYYFIQSDCNGIISNSDTLNLTPPATPTIDYVTVINNNFVEINYIQSTSPETSYYIFYSVQSGNNNNFDTISDITQTIYIDNQVSPNAGDVVKEYTIAAMDECFNTGPLSEVSHATILLQSFNDSCDNKVNLNWNLYKGWDLPEVARQELFVSNDFGAFVLDTILPNDLQNFVYQSFDAQNNIAFRMDAVRTSDEQHSRSNITTEQLEIATIPEYIYPRRVTYDDFNNVIVEYLVDNNAGLEVYVAKQSEDNNLYTNIETEILSNPIPAMLTYFSDDINGNNFGQYFLISVRDSCGIEYIPNPIKAIRLNAKPVNGFQNQLEWNEPVIDNATVTLYNIYRLESDSTWTFLGSNLPNNLFYFDFVGDVIPTIDGSNCYRVEAEYYIDYPLLPSEDLQMFSNIVCAIQPAVVYAPNAFAPQGANNIFKGVVVNADISNFAMLVMNKWGEVIFESNDPDIGWDGTYKGNLVPEGAYPYYFRFSNYNGVEKEKKGAVMLLR